MNMIFKILPAAIWAAAVDAGRFLGSGIDSADGFIHLSDASQAEETAHKYFAEQQGLVLVAFDADTLQPPPKWEASRGGALFPHVYGAIDPATALWAKPLPWNGQSHDFPAGWRG
jgi:uncharacterized protein (DUF952 family)